MIKVEEKLDFLDVLDFLEKLEFLVILDADALISRDSPIFSKRFCFNFQIKKKKNRTFFCSDIGPHVSSGAARPLGDAVPLGVFHVLSFMVDYKL